MPEVVAETSLTETQAPGGAAPDAKAERLRRFGAELDVIRRRAEAMVGAEDVARLRRLMRFSRAMEVVGRVLLHFSFEPIGFITGVLALFVHKQLQTTEIGHPVLHGAYDGLPGADVFNSKRFRWDMPVDEESWRSAHNIRHHQYTNIAGRDPDIHFGHVRLTDKTPHRPRTRVQRALALLLTFPNFGWMINAHVTGLIDVYFGNGRPERFDFIKDRSRSTVLAVHRRYFRKALPYYAKNYLLFPLLAGPGFLKVLAGNWLAETLRDIYSAATIYCGHVGHDVASYPEGTRAQGRGAWYAMQVEASNDFVVPRPFAVLCGGLDHQIEHHLFPRLPPQRLRQIAPEVRDVCERYGVHYKVATWPRTLAKAMRQVRNLGRGGTASSVQAPLRTLVSELA